MTHAIVPPYLLARIAAAREPTWARAAEAARATLEAPREYRPVRSRLRLSIEEPGTLVAESGPAPDRTISDAQRLRGASRRAGARRRRPADRRRRGRRGVRRPRSDVRLLLGRLSAATASTALGGPLLATVHYGRDYDNAFWNGERMVFGDGDGEVFAGFTGSLTVIAHELTHGVIEDEGGLVYEGQSGALNESIVRRLRRPHRAAPPRADRRRGELADRRGHLHGCRARASRCARWPRPARRTTTTCSAATRSPRTWATTSQTQRRQRRRAHQLRHPEPRVLPHGDARSAATRGSARG